DLLRECRKRGVATMVINGRISPRSFGRYRLVAPWFRRVLADVSRFCVQGEEAARRLAALGVDPTKIIITGSLKFDALQSAPIPKRGPERVLLFFAARHPDRFAEVERLCRHEGLATVRRTELPIDAEPKADAVVLDTIGELAQLYQIATAAFVGGSLVPAGGHNILEPAAHGKAIMFGPYMHNFQEIADTFLANGAAIKVQ